MNKKEVFGKRKTIRVSKCPNPLFEQWLEEWRAEAVLKNSDLQHCYQNALDSLRKYPLELNTGKECLILKNFGKHLCAKLDKKLTEHHEKNSGLNPMYVDNATTESKLLPPSLERKHNGYEKKSPLASVIDSRTVPARQKKYVPSPRSGAYAILIALFQEMKRTSGEESLEKTDLINKAQKFCDVSFTKPERGNHYTGWSSMSTLIKRQLVFKFGRPAKYSLTEEGKNLAASLSSKIPTSPTCSTDLCFDSSPESLKFIPGSRTSPESDEKFLLSSPKLIDSMKNADLQTFTNSPSQADFVDLTNDDDIYPDLENDLSSNVQSLVQATDSGGDNSHFTKPSEVNIDNQLIFVPGKFEIILLVDNRETLKKTRSIKSDDIIRDLTDYKVKFEMRQLCVGDFVWIARSHSGEELLLPYIVERKRMDDLASSIKDGRFHEQKFRLRQCGLKNVIYLIEQYGRDVSLGLPINTLSQAIVNTQLVDTFYVKFVNNHVHSIMYLSAFTRLLTKSFKDKTLISCSKKNLPSFKINEEIVSLMTYLEFSKSSIKSKALKIHEMFIKQLVQLKGLSVEKAIAIVKIYSSPRNLIRAFRMSENPEMLLSNIPYGLTNRNIGPTISKIIYKFYTSEQIS